MSNIKVLQTPEFLSMAIPTECIPQRFAIATNVLLCAVLDGENRGLLLFNYEPEKWNQWYPYFSSVNDMYAFECATYGDLVDIFKRDIMQRNDVQNRINKANMAFSKLLDIPCEDTMIGNSPVAPEMWLKYSKTQNLWTFYYMEFLQVTHLPKVKWEALDSNIVDFLPLQEDTIRDVLATGKYRGIDIVENTMEIIRNSKLLNELLCNTISV